MKLFRIAIALAFALGFGRAWAFHSGGVAECSGCHSMHSPAVGGHALLVGSDNASTCLSCHEAHGDTAPNSYHVSTPEADMAGTLSPIQRTPGGDFGWVKKTYTWSTQSGATWVPATEEGHEHGHNVVAADQGYVVDPVNAIAPGGTMSASNLSCVSCHDPHGQARRTTTTGGFAMPVMGVAGLPISGSGSYNSSAQPTATDAVGIYRILGGPGYARDGAAFTSYAVAVAPATYNRTESATDTRVAYGGTTTNSWGDWCGSCHGDMHSDSAAGKYVHPTEKDLDGLAPIYNAYVKSGDLSGATATAYTSLVPFAENTTDFTVLASHALTTGAGAAGNGPTASDRVVCLSCHRAHASAFPWALRWQPEYEFITRGGAYIAPAPANPLVTGSRAGVQARGRFTLAEQQAGYYDRPATKFATYQRLLCNKCHAKD